AVDLLGSPHELTAVDIDRLAGNEVARGKTQEYHGVRDVVAGPYPTDGQGMTQCGDLLVVAACTEAIGVDLARAKGIDGHVVLPEFLRHCLRQPHDGELRGAIRAPLRNSHLSAERGNVHDPSSTRSRQEV